MARKKSDDFLVKRGMTTLELPARQIDDREHVRRLQKKAQVSKEGQRIAAHLTEQLFAQRFSCRVCGSKTFSTERGNNGIMGPGGYSYVKYNTCDGCSVLFADAFKFCSVSLTEIETAGKGLIDAHLGTLGVPLPETETSFAGYVIAACEALMEKDLETDSLYKLAKDPS